jgi:choline dehydrogenase-like flavoprotein
MGHLISNDACIYDVIIVGSGITGGIASKFLTESGLNVLMIERGRKISHRDDYKTENINLWDINLKNSKNSLEINEQQFIQKKNYAFDQTTKHFYINDKENPYKIKDNKPFHWFRGDHLGGKSLLWHRQSFRLSPYEIDNIKNDDNGIEWPFTYEELSAWYDVVEDYIGVSGSSENLKQLPDGKFLDPFPLNAAEKILKEKIESNFSDIKMIISRTAHLTSPKEHHMQRGRSGCMSRDQCQRGCSFGAYYSTLSSSLPDAIKTGRLTVVTDNVVRKVMCNESNLATGVECFDRNTGSIRLYRGKIIMMCASTIGTTQILLNSISERFPNGIGNDSGVLGRYLMDHCFGAGATATMKESSEYTERGRRPTSCYIPKYQNLEKTTHNEFIRGFAFNISAYKKTWKHHTGGESFGSSLKNEIETNGDWNIYMEGFGEMLPNYKNNISLDFNDIDDYGMPKVIIDCEFSKNERSMINAMQKEAFLILSKSGAQNVEKFNWEAVPGHCIHEMGTARMGKDPSTSYLNKNNQCHAVKNLFVTDGSCMPSSGCQNPSLTYMAITARACHYIKNNFNSLLI